MPRLPNLVSGDIALYKTVLANGVKGYGTNTPPAASAGDCYIIGSAPTGAWVGSANKIAIYDGAAWGYIPTTGAIGTDQRNLVVAENGGGKTYRWFGAAWVEYAAPGSVNEVSYTYDPYPQYATRDELTTGGGSGDMILANAQTNSGAKTFLDATLLMRNVANTFSSRFTNANTGARVYTLKDADGTIAFTSDIAASDTVVTRNILTANTTIAAGFSAYIPGFAEIANTFTLEVGLASYLEIG
jgi:hypothetical protein